ncbi:MAG TPA: peptidoglycan recognition family protein [Vicinamibacterales bacterium]
MTKAADDFNAFQLANHVLKVEHVSELVSFWQEHHAGLTVDGKAGGQQTIPSIVKAIAKRSQAAPPGPGELRIETHWLVGPGVQRIDADPSWFGGPLDGGAPGGIVAHFTDTDPGTAVNMAKRRARKFGTDPDDRLASWHITVDTDGSIVVMIPLDHCAWHAGSPTARPVPGLGGANAHTVGIELVGFGKVFTTAQVNAAAHVWRAVVRQYAIPREFAMITHQSIDPTQRDDPGPVWMGDHAACVLDFAYYG